MKLFDFCFSGKFHKMKLSTEIEWPGSIKYYTVKTGNVNWKGCKMLLKNHNNIWFGEVMLKSNDVCPVISFKVCSSFCQFKLIIIHSKV